MFTPTTHTLFNIIKEATAAPLLRIGPARYDPHRVFSSFLLYWENKFLNACWQIALELPALFHLEAEECSHEIFQ